MKKIILVHGEDEGSKAAVRELNSIRFQYQNLISKNNIQILLVKDNQANEKNSFQSVPAIKIINKEKLLQIEGYSIDSTSNYKDYFLDSLELRELQPFDSWNWNENKWKWEPPIANLNENPDLFKWDEETQTWISKTNYSRFNPSIKEDMENIINEN